MASGQTHIAAVRAPNPRSTRKCDVHKVLISTTLTNWTPLDLYIAPVIIALATALTLATSYEGPHDRANLSQLHFQLFNKLLLGRSTTIMIGVMSRVGWFHQILSGGILAGVRRWADRRQEAGGRRRF